MGLDIYHLKATLKPENDYDYLEIDYFPKEAFDDYGFRKFITDSPFSDEGEKAIGNNEAGYQRKGVVSSFYDDFKNNGVYLNKCDFERLLNYLDVSDTLVDPKNIKKNFIENYEKGKSFLYVSW